LAGVVALAVVFGCADPDGPEVRTSKSTERTAPAAAAANDRDDQLLYQRAFEVALWAMPATDGFATREAIIRDLKKPNDIVINTRPMDSDIYLVALQTQTPYLQGAIDLINGPIVVEIPAANSESHLYGVISDAWQRPLEDIDVGLEGWDKGEGAKYL
jgi:hypothetical protein